MAEYITKGQAKKAISDYADSLGFDADTVPVEYLSEEIDGIPAADVAPVVHAKWEKDIMNSYHFCSHCAGTPFYIANEDEEELTPYCPRCGAKMDGEESEE